jgi:hypothetical protein
MKRFLIVIFLVTVVLGLRAASTIPRATAAHFCQLLVCDNDHRVMSLACYIRQNPSMPPDSLSEEQWFCTYVFNYDGWQSLRIFPHTGTDKRITWHAAAEQLPATIDAEHQKYIHEVFPRLIAEVEAENWPQVDAYIDRMLKYQTTFAAPSSSAYPLPLICIVLAALIVLILLARIRAFAPKWSNCLR